MLGYDVLVYYYDDQGKQRDLARWSADPAYGLDWINELVTEGRAALVQNGAGYPFGYEIAAAEILPMLSLAGREEFDRRIHRKPYSGDWNEKPFALEGGTINDDELAACPEDAVITVEAWDQS